MTLLWQGRGVVAISVAVTVLIAVLSIVMPGPALLNDDGAISLIGAIWQGGLFVIYAVPLIPVAYGAHIAVLRGEAGLAALQSQGWTGMMRFGRGMIFAAVMLAILVTLYQLVFVQDLLLMSAGRMDGARTVRLIFGGAVAFLVLAIVVLFGTRGAMSVQVGQARGRDVIAIGRKNFWFMAWRITAVVLVLPVLSALVLPMMGQVVAIMAALGMPADPAFLIVRSAFSGLIACFAVILISVTFCRAWLRSANAS
ncbi:hypothetical protein [Thalassospira sp.]|uniref:hypothetical protein n=1 Tax=Thalassospira sp. TaxID=1912094 RepID=UPI0032ED3F74